MLFVINDITWSTYQAVQAAYDDGIRDFQFEIDSPGGSLDAALRIYDLLRGDKDCIVSANVNGCCMSAATILLLAAPLDKRTATAHSTFMIHSPLMPIMQDVNKTSVNQIKQTIDVAYDQIKQIYSERTNLNGLIDEYMESERMFYTEEAIKAGFVNNKKDLYNKTEKMSRIRNLVNSIMMQLKNEKFITVENIEFEALAIEVGAPVDGLQDGVYELLTGEVITVDKGIIIDVIPKPEEKVETTEDSTAEPTVVEAEAETETEPAVEEVSVAEAKETVVETVEEVVEQVETAVSEEEIKEAVKTAIAELKQELENKYKNMVELVNSVGGTERLITLKNTMSEQKSFKSEVKNTKKSLNDLMAMVNK